ncbi:hypothetical protein KBD33_03780 [Candidatus Gracilibacteria bacterium]|nr:hypothetical protein [Candidatus Gracilibacteria bacterium]
MTHFSRNTSGFSTLMALGTIGILLIIVVGIANLFINELRLSRISYDEVVAYAGAEGAFEYGMLKVRNHREGFEDELNSSEPDGTMLNLLSDRSKNMKVTYTIESASSEMIFTVGPNEHLIIPLFASTEDPIIPGGTSKKPHKNINVGKVTNLYVEGINGLKWTIVAMSGSESTGLSGEDNISPLSPGQIREQSAECYDSNGDPQSCSITYEEKLEYFWDKELKVSDYLGDSDITDPYLMIFNSENSSKDIRIATDPTTPFSLPELTIEASAKKNQSLQVFRFREDHSKYYEALKYGIYNNEAP